MGEITSLKSLWKFGLFSPNTMALVNEKRDVETVEFKLYKYLGENLPVISCLDDLVFELRRVFESDSVNVELVHYLMKSYKSNPSEWRKYAKFDRYR